MIFPIAVYLPVYILESNFLLPPSENTSIENRQLLSNLLAILAFVHLAQIYIWFWAKINSSINFLPNDEGRYAADD